MNITLTLKEFEQLTQLKTNEVKHYENTIKQMKEAREQDQIHIERLQGDYDELDEECTTLELKARRAERRADKLQEFTIFKEPILAASIDEIIAGNKDEWERFLI